MNKSALTNLLAVLILGAGYLLPNPTLMAIGLFALSGAVTNWLAVHMLFERIPGLHGSGVIPLHFEELKAAIRRLMMDQFFNHENLGRFLAGDAGDAGVNLSPVIRDMDLSPAFDGLVKTIEESSFGGMLAMVGGSEGLGVLRQPFIERMKSTLIKIAATDQVQSAVRSAMHSETSRDGVSDRIVQIIDQRLDELTPQMVKKMIQDIIHVHLGWLVVWGGCLWWPDRFPDHDDSWPVICA